MVNKNVKGGIAGPVGGGGCSCGRGCSHSELEIDTRDELDSHSGCKGRDEWGVSLAREKLCLIAMGNTPMLSTREEMSREFL